MKKKNKYYLYEDIKNARHIKYDKPKRKKEQQGKNHAKNITR